MKNKSIFIAVLALFSAVNVHAAIAPDSTRYIYKGDTKFISAQAINESSETYGTQVWIDNIDTKDTKPAFVATPSFFKVAPKSRQVFRIMKVANHMPQNKESIYMLNLQEIPMAKKGSGLSMAIRTQIKLIYRPAALVAGRAGAEKNMTVERLPGQQRLTNTTPYIFAIGSVVDNKGKDIPLSKKDVEKLSMFKPGDSVNITGYTVKAVRALSDYGSLETYELKQGRSK